MRNLRIIGWTVALVALLVIAGALWLQAGNGRYQLVSATDVGVILVDTRSGRAWAVGRRIPMSVIESNVGR